MAYKTLFFIGISCLFFGFNTIQAQNKKLPYDIFYVGLKDKESTPYSVFKAKEFLSPRAIERRMQQGIFLDSTDLPIVPVYMDKIKALGFDIVNKSKWLNAVAVHVTDTSRIHELKNLDFVTEVFPLGYFRVPKAPKEFSRVIRDTMDEKKSYYGLGEHQALMLQVPQLHDMGITGKNVHIAIFDGGFENVYRMAAFDTLFARNQILDTKDFVEGDDFVYEDSGHGTDVLSCMGANMPYRLVGTAPDAFFYLFKTEDTKGEHWNEEFTWVAAAEYADSIGVEIINSSLGYTTFTDSIMNHNYYRGDLDGKTTIAAKGANIAVEKGIMVMNSAGNEGNKKWHFIGTPSDAPNVLAIAATDLNGDKAAFSSVGPASSGYLKPNLAAQGKDAHVASPMGMGVKLTSGTSFSSPILAGSIGLLRQDYKSIYSLDYKALLERTASQAHKPDTLLGYGIPQLLHTYLGLEENAVLYIQNFSDYYLNTNLLISNKLEILFSLYQNLDKNYTIQLVDQFGKEVYYKEILAEDITTQYLHKHVLEMHDLSNGLYKLSIKQNQYLPEEETISTYLLKV